MNEKKEKTYFCPVEFTLDTVAGKWKILILHHLRHGTKRFGELAKRMPDASQKVLNQHLKELEKHGIINRKVYSEVPPKVEYSITSAGEELFPILDAMYKWGFSRVKKNS